MANEPGRRTLREITDGPPADSFDRVTFTQVGWLVRAVNGTPFFLLGMHGITENDLKGCTSFAPVWVEGPNE